MPSNDWIVRGLLGGILCCLVALLVQERALSQAAGPLGRYLVTNPEEGSHTLVRIDSVTGRSWKLALSGGEARWEAFAEGEPVALAAVRRSPLAGSPPVASPRNAAAPPRDPLSDPRAALTPELGRALQNPELPSEIRVWAAYQLAQVPGEAAARLLIEVLDDPEGRVIRAALEALASHSGPSVRAALESMRAHPDPHVSRRVGELLRERS